MNDRILTIERDIAALKQDVACLLASWSTLATKADLDEELSRQARQICTYLTEFGSLLIAAVYLLAKHLP
jgi:hypothetical protein